MSDRCSSPLAATGIIPNNFELSTARGLGGRGGLQERRRRMVVVSRGCGGGVVSSERDGFVAQLTRWDMVMEDFVCFECFEVTSKEAFGAVVYGRFCFVVGYREHGRGVSR